MNKRYSLIILILAINYVCFAADQQKSPSIGTNSNSTTGTTKKLYKKTTIIKNKKPPKKAAVTVTKDQTKDQLLKKTIRDMSVKELVTAKEYAAALSKKELVVKYIKQLILDVKEPKLLSNLRLELADIYFENGDMKKAGQLYLEYIKFYPGSKSSDYAEYKSVLSRFYARLKPPLDQTKTRRTINLANRYLKGSELPNKEYAQEVEKIRRTCYQDLYEYEKDIVEQYFNLGKITAAETRIDGIKKEFLPVLKEIEPQLIEFEGLLAQRQGKGTIAEEKVAELKTKFPAYETHKLALNKPTKKSNANRF